MGQRTLKTKGHNLRNNRKRHITFLVNIILPVSGTAMAISGFIIQCQYHLLGNHGESVFLALNRAQWNDIHVLTSVFFLLVTIYHIYAHRKWYANIFKHSSNLYRRPLIILAVLTFMTVISGLIPLFILYSGNNSAIRFSIIEIHDKIAVLFFIALLLHTIKRIRWYINIIKMNLH